MLVVLCKLAPRYGGPPRRTVEFCSALAARGHHVELFTTNVDGRSRLDVPLNTPLARDGFRVTYHDARPLHRYGLSLPLLRSFRARLREFDVVHLKGAYEFPIVTGAFFCRRHGIPYVVEPSGVFDAYHRRKSRGKKALHDRLAGHRTLGGAAAIRYGSEAERLHAAAAGLRAPAYVIPPGIAFPARGELEVPRDLGLVAYVGRLSAKKGLDLLLEAFAIVAAVRPEARLVIAGNDDEGLTRALRDCACSLRVEQLVAFAGPVEGAEKHALLARASAFVLPSEAESFGAAAYEAMAMGTPVVVTTGVANHEEIRVAGAGLVAARTRESVAGAIIDILANDTLARSLARTGRTHAVSRYSSEHAAAELEMMYFDLVRAHEASAPVGAAATRSGRVS
ncbi:MAG: glycosyltransferase [Gaiellaceae bacterium]